MNEPNDKIEQMLGRMELHEPPASLDQRMSDLFAHASSAKGVSNAGHDAGHPDQAGPFKFKASLAVWSLGMVAGIAAMVAVALLVGQNMAPTSPTGEVANGQASSVSSASTASANVGVRSVERNPVESIGPQLARSNVQVGDAQFIDEGFTTTPSGDPVRVLRRESMQRSMWVDPDTQAYVQVEVPNEEVVLINSPTY